jgi:predicted transcriptional regulator
MQYRTEKTLQLRKVLGKKIKELRNELTGLSGNMLANSYDIGNGNLSRIENGIVDCKFITVWKIAEALGIKFSDFAKLLEDELGEDFKLIDQ